MIPWRSESGVSLIEVLVSLVLFAVALLGIAAAYPLSRSAVSAGGQATVAVGLARQTLEEMRNRRYTSTIDDITASNFPSWGYDMIPNFPTFRRTVSITDGVPEASCTPSGTPCSKRVSVTVVYRNSTGQEQAVTLTTIFVR
jgi:prepilin-type N-terminal cleavage/methylation domain-containing protein